jgi:hypothetical protein
MKLRAVVSVLMGCIVVAVTSCAAGTGAAGERTARSDSNIPRGRPRHTAQIDPELTIALRNSTWVRALVTVADAEHPSVTGATGGVGISAGPFQAAKIALVNEMASGVRVVRDYDRLPVLLIEIRNASALAELANRPEVVSVQLERRRHTALPIPAHPDHNIQ